MTLLRGERHFGPRETVGCNVILSSPHRQIYSATKIQRVATLRERFELAEPYRLENVTENNGKLVE